MRVNERHLEAEEAAAGTCVDQLSTAGDELVQRRADVRDLVGDVVHAGSPPGEEPADRRVVAERSEELDTMGADSQRNRLDALLDHRLAMLELGAEEPLVRRDGLVEVVDGNSEMVNPARLHAADATARLVGSDGSPRHRLRCRLQAAWAFARAGV